MLKQEQKSTALVHGYGFDTDDHGFIRPDLRGRLQIFAGLELLKRGKAENLVFTGGQIDPTKPPMAQVMQDYASRIFPNRTKHFIAIPLAYNTREEISEFKKITEQFGLSNLIDIASSPHIPRIIRAVKSIFKNKNIPVLKTEDILTSQVGTDKYSEIIHKLQSSSDEATLKKQEMILNLIDSIPLFGPYLLSVFAHILHNKYSIQSKVLKFM